MTHLTIKFELLQALRLHTIGYVLRRTLLGLWCLGANVRWADGGGSIPTIIVRNGDPTFGMVENQYRYRMGPRLTAPWLVVLVASRLSRLEINVRSLCSGSSCWTVCVAWLLDGDWLAPLLCSSSASVPRVQCPKVGETLAAALPTARASGVAHIEFGVAFYI